MTSLSNVTCVIKATSEVLISGNSPTLKFFKGCRIVYFTIKKLTRVKNLSNAMYAARVSFRSVILKSTKDYTLGKSHTLVNTARTRV